MTPTRILYLVVLFAMTISPTGQSRASELLVFVSAFAPGDNGAIHAYQLNLETGQLNQVYRATDVEHPFFMSLSPDQKFLYSIHAKKFGSADDEHVSAYEIVDGTGRLKLLNRQSTHGSASCYIDVDSTGKTVLVANYRQGSVAAFPVQANGSLGEAATFIQHEGSSVNSERQASPHAHCIVVSPNNRHVYVNDLGIDQVRSYRLDASTAKLTPNQQPFVRSLPGAGPRHLTFHPNGKLVYVINELANSITAFNYDPETGFLIEQQTISTVPADFKGTGHTADLRVTPDSRFLYGTNRGHDSIASYRIGDAGRLTLIGIEPSLGNGPQNLAITPDGEFCLCANMGGDGNVSVFRIAKETGKLTSVGPPTAMPSPSCILIWK
jgi:6-phosphogluconolactonase